LSHALGLHTSGTEDTQQVKDKNMAAMAPALIATLVIGGTMAYMQYQEARKANRNAVAAAESRNQNLRMKYAQEGAVESTKNERQQKKMAQESYIKTEQIAASVASSAVASGSGTSRQMQGSVSDSYAIAGSQLGSSSSQAQQMGYLGLNMGIDQTQQALASNWQNPMQQAFGGMMQGIGMYQGISAMGEENSWWNTPMGGNQAPAAGATTNG
jgi:hypothetical protein